VLVAVVVAGGFVAWAWAPDQPADALMARWGAPPSRIAPILGLPLHLRDEGPREDPVPVLLLHGTSASLHTWEGWGAELAKQRRVISLDLPGFGLTGPFADGDYRVERYTDFLLAVLEHLQVERVVLVGNSFGGQLAWRFALAHPERSARLVLVDAAGYPRNAESVPIGFRLAGIPALAPVMSRVLPRSMIESSLRNVYGDPDKVDDELVERYYQLTLREGNRQALRQRFVQAPSGELHQRIGELRLPTLIIWGGRDRLIPPDNAERFAADIAGSQLVLFDDLGHVPQEEDPQRSVAALNRFLAR
jgi:pimeloyl-ACP methyl ester carboxylesterase